MSDTAQAGRYDRIKKRIAMSVWTEAERDYRYKARLAERIGRHELAQGYLRAAEEAIIRAQGREP